MKDLGRVSMGVLALAMSSAMPASAWAQDAHAGHHPAEAPAATAQPSVPSADKPDAMPGHPAGTGGMGMNAGQGMPMKDGMMGGGMAMCGMMGGGMNMSAHIDERLNAVRRELAITPAQASVWEAYAGAARGAAANMDRVHATMMSDKGAAPVSPVERLDRHDRMLAVARENIGTLRPALVRLYAALSVEQKQKADTLLMPHGMMQQPMPMDGTMRN